MPPPPSCPASEMTVRSTGTMRPLSVISPPVTRFPLIECVLSIHGGGARDGREEETGMRGGEEGGGVCDERALSLFSSFQLLEASHQTGLNSRHDTIGLSSAATFLCPYLTHASSHTPPPHLSRLWPLST